MIDYYCINLLFCLNKLKMLLIFIVNVCLLEKMAIAASENYQLKWHSYGAHLHSSVATLLHSESFADVLLATSCGRHVAAHRFVLAACSSYLSHIFQTCHFGANTNAPIIVVSYQIN